MSAGQAMNVTWHEHKVASADRKKLNGNKSCVVWFTGLSASGKSTIANTVDHKLHALGKHTYILDGDNVRMGLNAGPPMLKERFGDEFAQRFGLGFGAVDRAENIRRIGEVAKLFADAGIITLTAFISPYRIDRDNARAIFKDGEFIEIFVKASVETCEKRDPKGLYKKARAGEIKNFTGISDPYEEPLKPELVLDSDSKNIDQLADEVVAFLKDKGYLNA
jgi:adenylylsulfate kinase